MRNLIGKFLVIALLSSFSFFATSSHAQSVTNSQRFTDVLQAYYCRAIIDSLGNHGAGFHPRLDPQSTAVAEECSSFFEKRPKFVEYTNKELGDSLSELIKGQWRGRINNILANLQTDFIQAEATFPYAPAALWNAIASLHKDLSRSLNPLLIEQAQREKDGEGDLVLQSLYAAMTVFSITKLGGQVGTRSTRALFHNWGNIKASIQSVESTKLMLRSMGDGLRRIFTGRMLVIWGREFKDFSKTVGISVANTVRNPGTLIRGDKSVLQKSLNAVSNNQIHLYASAAGAMSFAAYKMWQKEILDPQEMLNNSIEGVFFSLHNEWTLIREVSMMKSAEELEKFLNDYHKSQIEEMRKQEPNFVATEKIEKNDLFAIIDGVQEKLESIYEIANGRNLNLPFELVSTDLESAKSNLTELGIEYVPPTVVTPAAAENPLPAAQLDQNSTTNRIIIEVGTNRVVNPTVLSNAPSEVVPSTNSPAKPSEGSGDDSDPGREL